jgi:hypothetical protein
MTLMITPNHEGRLRGWRRAHKLGRRRLSPFCDPATAFPWVAVMVAIGGVGWYLFAREVVESHWFPGQELAPYALWAFLLVLATGGMGFHSILEGRGGRSAGITVIFIGVVPIMAGSVVAIINNRFAAPATWLFGMSPAASPALASMVVAPLAEMPTGVLRAMPRAFWFWQAIAALVALRLMAGLYRALRATADKAAGEEERAASGAAVGREGEARRESASVSRRRDPEPEV